MSRDGHRRRNLTYEERVLWTAITKAIKPLRDLPLPAPGEALGPTPDAEGRPLAPPKFIKPAKAPAIVGIARKNENSAAVRLSAPKAIAPTIDEPERDTPGIIARHWQSPIPSALSGGISITS